MIITEQTNLPIVLDWKKLPQTNDQLLNFWDDDWDFWDQIFEVLMLLLETYCETVLWNWKQNVYVGLKSWNIFVFKKENSILIYN